MRRTIPFLGVAVLVLALAPPVRATSGTMIITSDTMLTEDHDAGSETLGIVLAADDITLDCAGHQVTGSGNVGVYVDNHDGTTVQNCVVTGFTAGIQVFGSSNTLRGNEVSDAVGSGVFVAGNDNLLVGNRSSGNGDSGFRLGWSSSGNAFVRNRATTNGGTGFVLDHSPDTRVVENVSRGNQNGFVWTHAQGGLLRGNSARGNSDQGFTIQRVRGLRLIADLARRNGGRGFLLFRETRRATLWRNTSRLNRIDGFALYDVSSSDIRSNAAFGNGIYGFDLGGGSNDDRFVRNAGCGNGRLDAIDRASGTGNVWRENDFCTSGV